MSQRRQWRLANKAIPAVVSRNLQVCGTATTEHPTIRRYLPDEFAEGLWLARRLLFGVLAQIVEHFAVDARVGGVM